MPEPSDPISVYALPDDLFPGNGGMPEGLIFHPYKAPIGSFKGRSVLTMNSISLVIKGEKTIHFAEKRVEIKPDEFHFLSTGNCLVSMDISRKDPFASILIFFSNAVLEGFFRKYADKIAAGNARRGKGDEPYLAFKKDAFVNLYIESLSAIFRQGTRLSAEMKQVKFEELMLYLLERHPQRILSFQVSKGRTDDDIAIRMAVERNLTTPIDLEEIAFLCNLSLSTFKRRFLKIYGVPPKQWMLRKRMELAAQMLGRGREKPSEIYHRLGYRNHSSFTESFKEIFGVTPKAYQSARL